MKCRYLFRVHEPRKEHHDDPRLECEDGVYYWPVGTEEEHPKAYIHVRNGMAEAADDECRLRAAKSTEEMNLAGRQYEMVNKGIQPEDYQRYLDGEILGYDVDGNDIPGPNYKPPEDTEDEDDDE